MFVVDRVLGNIKSDESLALEVQRKEKLGEVENVFLPFQDAGRRRLRVTSDAGLAIGVNLAESEAVKDGDVLVAGDDTDKLVLIKVAPSEAMEIRLSEELAHENAFEFGVKIGHMLGNQHWPITISDDVVLTPLSIDKKVMETVIKTHGFKGIETRFVPVEPGDVPAAMPHIEHDHG